MCVYPASQSLNSSRYQISARRSSGGLANDELSKSSNLSKYNLDHHRKSSDFQKTTLSKIDSKKLILYKKGVRIGTSFYIVEISVDKNYFQIVLDDVENPDTKIIAMRLEEGQQLISENNNNYEKIISKIYFENGKPRITGFYEENMSQQEKLQIEKLYVEENVTKEKEETITKEKEEKVTKEKEEKDTKEKERKDTKEKEGKDTKEKAEERDTKEKEEEGGLFLTSLDKVREDPKQHDSNPKEPIESKVDNQDHPKQETNENHPNIEDTK